MAWIELIMAMALFLASHRIPALFGLKAQIVATLGQRGYITLFSIASLALLWWLISAASRAPFVPIWDQMPWHRWVVNIAMPLATLLTVFGTAAPNPFAFEGSATGFNPTRPGIAGLTRQPLLWALALWSGAHLLANGDLAHVILFAPFLMLAVLGMPMVEKRRRRAMGAATWARQAGHTGLVPFAALITGRWRPQALPNLWRLALVLAAWASLWHLHPVAIGMWPGP